MRSSRHCRLHPAISRLISAGCWTSPRAPKLPSPHLAPSSDAERPKTASSCSAAPACLFVNESTQPASPASAARCFPEGRSVRLVGRTLQLPGRAGPARECHIDRAPKVLDRAALDLDGSSNDPSWNRGRTATSSSDYWLIAIQLKLPVALL